jgi:hypothetical protein
MTIKPCDLNQVSHGTRSYIYMYINAVSNGAMLQLRLRHDFYKVAFKIKQIICPQGPLCRC